MKNILHVRHSFGMFKGSARDSLEDYIRMSSHIPQSRLNVLRRLAPNRLAFDQPLDKFRYVVLLSLLARWREQAPAVDKKRMIGMRGIKWTRFFRRVKDELEMRQLLNSLQEADGTEYVEPHKEKFILGVLEKRFATRSTWISVYDVLARIIFLEPEFRRTAELRRTLSYEQLRKDKEILWGTLKPFDQKYRFRIIPVTQIVEEGGHQLMLVFDAREKQIEFFDPHGCNAKFFAPIKLYCDYHMTGGWKLVHASSGGRCLRFGGPQAVASIPNGMCITWCIMYVVLRLSNPENTPYEVTAKMMDGRPREILLDMVGFYKYVVEKLLVSDPFNSVNLSSPTQHNILAAARLRMIPLHIDLHNGNLMQTIRSPSIAPGFKNSCEAEKNHYWSLLPELRAFFETLPDKDARTYFKYVDKSLAALRTLPASYIEALRRATPYKEGVNMDEYMQMLWHEFDHPKGKRSSQTWKHSIDASGYGMSELDLSRTEDDEAGGYGAIELDFS